MTYEARELDKKFHLHPQTDAIKHEIRGPLMVTRGHGCSFTDDEGRSFLDMHSGLWCSSLGFSQPRLREAALRQMEKLPYVPSFRHKSNEPATMLAKKLIDLAPVPMSKVMFQCSGTEANDTSIKMIWYYWNALGQPERKKIISRSCAYHGTSVVASSMSGLPSGHGGFGLPLPGFIHVSHPDLYRGAAVGETEDEYATRLAQELEARIIEEGPESIAAFIAEPVIGGGGLYPPPKSYFPKIQEVTDKYGILFIADEVICGFGRTGDWWGTKTFNIKPDIITCAKGLSAAFLPISAVMINRRIYDVIKTESHERGGFGHGYTYGGHPVCAAVALEALAIYEEMDVLNRVRSKGQYLQSRLDQFRHHPNIGDIRGLGLMWGLEIVEDKKTKTRFPPKANVGNRLSDICLTNGMNIRALAGHTMAFTPPFVISEEELDFSISCFETSLNELTTELARAA